MERADLAVDSELFIFSDGARDASNIAEVNAVRAILGEPWAFQSVSIVERDRNWGLAANVIDGVTSIVNRYGKVIVLEDDLEISNVGLRYFNDALANFEQEDKVMSVSGYMYPVRDADKLPKTFFFRVVNSWGWATWERAWSHFDTDIAQLTADFSKDDIKRFSVGHSENFWKQVKAFKAGTINSWAIRWYLSVFNQGGLTLYPSVSMIQNIGTDGSGTHSDSDEAYRVTLATEIVTDFPTEIEEDQQAYDAIRHFYRHRKGGLIKRLIRYARKKWKR